MPTLIDKADWVAWLQAKNLSDRTINEYCSYYDKLPNDNITQNSCIAFINKNNNPVARAFINNLLWYLKFKGQDHNITLPKITGRKKKKLPSVLSRDDIHKLADSCGNERTRLMILITFYGGLRVSELVGQYHIKPYSFAWNSWLREPERNGMLKLKGKGGKERIVFIPQELMARVYRWIKDYASKKQGKDDKLFKIGERRWKIILSENSNRALGRHIHPHLIRHSCGSWLRDRGWDLKEIADYLGHDSVVTTQIYTHISKEKLRDRFNEIL